MIDDITREGARRMLGASLFAEVGGDIGGHLRRFDADGHRLVVGFTRRARSCAGRNRGTRAPVLAQGDGALGFWRALGDAFPETRAGRCWFHHCANVMADHRRPPGAGRHA